MFCTGLHYSVNVLLLLVQDDDSDMDPETDDESDVLIRDDLDVQPLPSSSDLDVQPLPSSSDTGNIICPLNYFIDFKTVSNVLHVSDH